MNGLLFIRHAETDMAGRFCGHSDPPINGRGEQQILALVESLEPASVHALYCSDLQRAVVTAELLAEAFAVPVFKRRNLREIHFGDWEGLSWDEIELRDAVYAKEWVKMFPSLSAPGGESFRDFETRILGEVDELLRLAKDRRIAIVTHGGVMRVALQKFCNCSEEETWSRTKDYCSSFLYAEVTDLQEVSQ